MNRILIYRLGSLGDTLLALPAFHLIRNSFPKAHITLLTNLPVQPKAPSITTILPRKLYDEVIEYPVGLRQPSEIAKLRTRLVNGPFDLVISLAAPRGRLQSLRDFLFFKSCRIPRIKGIPWCNRDLRCLPRRDSELFEWEASRIASRVRWLGDARLYDNASWDLALTPEETNEANRILKANGLSYGFLAASLGGKADVKDWTDPHWKQLFAQLSSRHLFPSLVMFGASAENPRSEAIRATWKGTSVNLCGQVTPRVAAAILAHAMLFIGHDSGPMHLAATVGTPCVAIFSGQAPPGQWFPRGSQNEILFHPTPCVGCGLETCLEYQKACILSIKVDDALAAVERIMKRNVSQPSTHRLGGAS